MVWTPQESAPLRLVRAGRSSSRLVGRERELGQLRRALGQIDTGNAVFILGEPGIGKSRLLDELRNETSLPADRFLVGACPPLAALATPYAPFTSALRGVARRRGRAWLRARFGPRLRDLGPVIPSLADNVLAAWSPEDTRARLFEAVHELLETVAEDETVVLAIEDLHWATDSTVALLAALLGDLPDGLLLIATARELGLTGHPAAVIAEASRVPGQLVIRPSPFSVEEVAALATNIIGRPLAPDAARDIHERSGGNPFLVEELLSGGDAGRSPSPTLSLRLAALPDQARLVAGLVAIHAEPVALDLLARATRLPEVELREALDAAQNAGLLTADPKETTYRCRHALVRDAVTEALGPLERRRLHGLLAAAMEARGLPEPGDVGRAAGHWLAGGEGQRALPLLVRSSDEIARAGGITEAIATAAEALTTLRGLPPDAAPDITEAVLVGRIAGLLAAKGDREAADSRFVEAIALSRDEEERLLLVATRAQWLWFAGLERDALPFRRELAEVGARRGGRIRSLDLLGSVVRAMVGESRFREAEPLARLALRRARQARRTDIEAGALAALGLLLGFTHRAAEGAHALRLAGDLAAAYGDLEQLMLAAGNHVGLLADAERHDEVLPAIEHWLDVGRRLELAMLLRDMELLRVEELVWLGQWSEADVRLGDTEGRPQLGPGLRLKASVARAQMAIGRGQLDMADAALAAAADVARSTHQAHYAGPDAYWRAQRALLSGEPDIAAERADAGLAALANAVENGRWYELWALAAGIQVDRITKGAADARTRLAGLRWLEHQRRQVTRASGLNPGAVAACRATVAAHVVAVRGRDAAGHWEEAARQWQRVLNPARATAAWLAAARTCIAADRTQEARRAAKRAIDLGSPVGLRPLVDEATSILERADGRRREGMRLGAGRTLTARELEVLRLIAAGRTNREIAAALVIGEKTAATHVSNVLAKLGATRRTEAAVTALRLGIAPAEGVSEVGWPSGR